MNQVSCQLTVLKGQSSIQEGKKSCLWDVGHENGKSGEALEKNQSSQEMEGELPINLQNYALAKCKSNVISEIDHSGFWFQIVQSCLLLFGDINHLCIIMGCKRDGYTLEIKLFLIL